MLTGVLLHVIAATVGIDTAPIVRTFRAPKRRSLACATASRRARRVRLIECRGFDLSAYR